MAKHVISGTTELRAARTKIVLVADDTIAVCELFGAAFGVRMYEVAPFFSSLDGSLGG